MPVLARPRSTHPTALACGGLALHAGTFSANCASSALGSHLTAPACAGVADLRGRDGLHGAPEAKRPPAGADAAEARL